MLFSFLYACIICNETLFDNNHGREEMENRKYSLSKTHPMKECHGLEFRLPLTSHNTQEDFQKVR